MRENIYMLIIFGRGGGGNIQAEQAVEEGKEEEDSQQACPYFLKIICIFWRASLSGVSVHYIYPSPSHFLA